MLDYLVIFGRFQPPHREHSRVIEQGLKCARQLIVLFGAVDLPRSIQHPWTFDERVEMLESTLAPDASERICMLPAPDNLYRSQRWAKAMSAIVAAQVAADGRAMSAVRIGSLGTGFDVRAQARQGLSAWPGVNIKPPTNNYGTDVRAQVFQVAAGGEAQLEQWLSAAVLPALRATLDTAWFAELQAEFAANDQFREAWRHAPWPPIHVTVDAIVIVQEQVLLVQRARHPGKGLWALPGGFLDSHETLVAACIRELYEETHIEIERSVLSASMRLNEVFDNPVRSARGRTITHAYLFDLGDIPLAPSVTGGDDARLARWFAFERVQRGQLFEDHYAILQAMIGLE